MYKKVSDTTVCISSKSSEKHLLVDLVPFAARSDNMKPIVFFCLFAACCFSLATANGTGRSQESRKLEEVLRHLRAVKESLQQTELLLNTPPQNIQDCCCLPALQCFRDNLPVQNGAEKKRVRLFKSLNHPLTERGLNFCATGNNLASCQACASHPKQNATIFFNRLETLIQSAFTRLTN
ncbi:interleukin-21 [Labrus mixtus]|uniref:interleukin-21 n=1 Tax=Labrus mixtus TaxID=508554 RepID=UPI0029C0A57C|nr:interleukin-21 [Labrus mixtus]